MKPNHINLFIQTHWKELYRFTLSAADSRFRRFGLGRSRVVNSQDSKDIVNRVMLKVCTPPYEINSDDLTLEKFKRKLNNLVSTEVSKLIRNRKGKHTELRDPLENMSDDHFFDWLLAEEEASDEHHETHRQIEERLEQIKQLLIRYEETDIESYFVLDSWIKGKSIEETAIDNGILLKDVKNSRKRIRTALRGAK